MKILTITSEYIHIHTQIECALTAPCTSLLFILLFIKSQYTVFAHLIVLHFLHILLLFLFFYHIYALVLCYFYIISIFILLHCPLSGPDLIYISLLIIPCIIYYVTNKETLNHVRHQRRRAGRLIGSWPSDWIKSWKRVSEFGLDHKIQSWFWSGLKPQFVFFKMF